MKALFVNGNKNDKKFVLKEIEDRKVKDHEIKIRVKSVPLTTGDIAMMDMKPRNGKVAGQFFSGEIVSKGENIVDYSIGDRVCGLHKQGTLSEYIYVNEKKTFYQIPEEMTYETSVSLLFGGSAALFFLKKWLKSDKKKWVLINGASGEVGLMALQIVKAYGHHVTAVSTTKNFDMLGKYGADRYMDYTLEDVYDTFDQFDLVFDAVGKLNPQKAIRYIPNDSYFVTTQIGLGLIGSLLKNFILRQTKIKIGVAPFKKDNIETLFELYSVGSIKSSIDSRYDVEDINKAYARVKSGMKTGTVIINM